MVILVVFQNIWVPAHPATPQDKPAFLPGIAPQLLLGGRFPQPARAHHVAAAAHAAGRLEPAAGSTDKGAGAGGGGAARRGAETEARETEAAAEGTAAPGDSVGRNLVPPPSSPAPKDSKWMV